jgi:SAM-dependent methyltransferase
MPTYAEILRWIKPDIEFHQHRYARGLADLLPDRCRWLDVGAGTKIQDGWLGPTESELASRASLLVGCDVVSDHLSRNPFLSAAVAADGRSLPFAPQSFDVVTANMVLEHLENPREVFAEIARVLAPRGLFVFVTPNHANPVIWAAASVFSQAARKTMATIVERRAAEHVFLTYYRANSTSAIGKQIAGLPLRLKCLDHFSTEPFIKSPWIITLVEAVWLRLIGQRPFKKLRTNLFGVIERV